LYPSVQQDGAIFSNDGTFATVTCATY